jgi:hypothetical protein
MKKVIVTGGAGFIGSHTCVELVAAGMEPVIVDDFRNSDERVLQGLAKIIGRVPKLHRIDCTDEKALDQVLKVEAPDGVIHFAADKAVGESVARPAEVLWEQHRLVGGGAPQHGQAWREGYRVLLLLHRVRRFRPVARYRIHATCGCRFTLRVHQSGL